MAQEFGYKLTRKKLDLPKFPGELDRLQELRDRIEEVLPFVPLTNELARREILISRVITELIHYSLIVEPHTKKRPPKESAFLSKY